MEGSEGMRARRIGLVGIVGGVVLLAGCGTADEAQLTATSTAAITSSVTGSEDGSESVSASSPGSSQSVPEPTASSEESQSAPVASTEPSVSATGGPGGNGGAGPDAPATTPGGATAGGGATIPTYTASPGTFPDREEVEAQGVATNPLCEVLSTDEVSTLLGVAVRPAADAAAGTGCLWTALADDGSFLQLQMVGDPARYAPPAGAESLTGIGDAAAVAVADGVWTAQAQNPDGTFAVQLAGPTAGRDGAVEGLRRLLERY